MAELLLGIDLGGTDCKFGLVDTQGRVIRKVKHATDAHLGPETVLARIANHARDLARGETVRAAGMGVPGPMSSRLGMVFEAPNLPGWIDTPVRDILTAGLGMPVTVHNDANAAAYGEFWAGAGRGTSTMVLFTLGTGVGGGIILGGELYTGPDDTAGELGHMSIHFDGRLCNCGARGCVEAYASATAVDRMVREAIASGAKTVLAAPADPAARIGAKAVADAARSGDALARGVWDQVAFALGVATANIVNIFNPDMVVFGGAMAGAGDLLFEPIRRIVKERAFDKPVSRARIEAAALGTDAGIVGAAGLALRERG
jgi:glucokinase